MLQCTTNFVATGQYGFGKDGMYKEPAKANASSLLKVWYASELLYVLSVGLTRISTALFLGGLSRAHSQKLTGWCLAAVAGAWSIASVVTIAVRGDISQPWATPGPLVRNIRSPALNAYANHIL